MQSLALLLLRLSFGLGIAVHGYVPLFVATEGMEGMADLIAKYEWPAPVAWAYLAKVTEMVGGLLIAVGLLTRACALACAFTMGVGFYMAHWPGPFMASENGYELALLYGTVFLALVLMGAGKISLDGFRARSDRTAQQGGAEAPAHGEWASPAPTPHGAGAVPTAAAPAAPVVGAPVTGAAAVWDGNDDGTNPSSGS